MLGGIAEGETRISGFLAERGLSGDRCGRLRRSACASSGRREREVRVHGVGAARPAAPRRAPLDMGNAGTAMRLMMGLLAAAALRRRR